MRRINKDTRIGDLIQVDEGIVTILMGAGMHCIGCPSSANESLEQACDVHGIDCEMLLDEILTYLDSMC